MSSNRIASYLNSYQRELDKFKHIGISSHVLEENDRVRQQQVMLDNIKNSHLYTAIPDFMIDSKNFFNMFTAAKSWAETVNQTQICIDRMNVQKELKYIGLENLESFKSYHQKVNFLSFEIERINDVKKVFESVVDKIQDFNPKVEFLNEGIVIENKLFYKNDISQIAEDYIWDDDSNKNIFQQTDKKEFWNSIPKPVLWIILAVLILYVRFLT